MRRVTILYDRIEDDVYERARAAGEDTTELVPVHVPLGETLARRGHEVRKIAATPDVRRLFADLAADDSEVVFNICDGLDGETHAAVGVVHLLELLGKPFTGATSWAMALAGDKCVTKQIFAALGVATPAYTVVGRGEVYRASLDFPLIVKPIDQDASVGITERSVVQDEAALNERARAIHDEFGTPALVEQFIPGREIYASVLGNDDPRVLPLVEWPMTNGDAIGSFDAKWQKDHENYQKRADVFPDDLPKAVVERIQRDALAGYRALKLTGYARLDIRLAEDGTPHFLEANPNPFFDATAEVAMSAEAAGIDYGSLAEMVIELGIERGTRRPSVVAKPERRRRRRRPPKKKAA